MAARGRGAGKAAAAAAPTRVSQHLYTLANPAMRRPGGHRGERKGVEAAEKGKTILTNRPLMRKPRGKTAKKRGDSGPGDEAEKDGKEREGNRGPLTKVLRTMGTGGGWGGSHLTIWLPLYSPVWFFRGLVRSTGEGKQAEKKLLLIF